MGQHSLRISLEDSQPQSKPDVQMPRVAPCSRWRLLTWYSNYGELSTTKFNTLEDEKRTYQQWGWTWAVSQEPVDAHKPDYAVSWRNVDVHNDSEADDLWQNIIMAVRTGRRGYLDRAVAWARYFKWEYPFRTDGFMFSGSREEITIPLTSADSTYLQQSVSIGKIDTLTFNADHLYGWGLIDYYYLTGDRDALEAATDIAENSEFVYSSKKPGTYPMGFYGFRQGARHLLFITRLYESTLSARWQAQMNHLAQLWLQSPDWDESLGTYYFSSGGFVKVN